LDFQDIFDAVGEFFENPMIQLAIQAFVVYVVVIWLATAFWAFRDLQLRTSNAVLPYLAAATIILFTPVFFLLGVIVYRIVRPQERIAETAERHLAEEAMLAEVELVRTCPTCKRRTHEEWIICPTCRTRLNRVCPNCGKLVGTDWSLCAWCGKDFERPAPVESLPARQEPAAIPPGRTSTGRSASIRTSSPSAARPRPPRPTSSDAIGPADAVPER
jgi:RNA polymerase subunit RPABC4/transcription elongation factor Spt4